MELFGYTRLYRDYYKSILRGVGEKDYVILNVYSNNLRIKRNLWVNE